MRNVSSLTPYYQSSDKHAFRTKSEKISFSLIKHVYDQTLTAMVASLLCTSLIVIGLYNPEGSNVRLLSWSALTFIITFARIALSSLFKRNENIENRMTPWCELYILGAILGGACWGFMGVYLFPTGSPVEQTFMILMVAGVTAGSVPLSAAIPGAAIGFLLTATVPLIATIAVTGNHLYHLFDLALSVYLVYMIVITLKTYRLIRNSIILKYDNDILLANLETTNKKLEQAATHDPLTKIPNRTLFQENLRKALLAATLNSRFLALLYIDLDNFKIVNDMYGHHAGDRVLQIIINRLRSYLHKNDNLARLGGDELAVIIDHAHDHEEIETIASKICRLIAIPIKVGELSMSISASIGISVFPDDGLDEESLLKNADKCMYYAKEHGGNQFYFSKKLVS